MAMLLTVIFHILTIPFLTLLERLVMSCVQGRLGPIGPLYFGVLISFSSFFKFCFKNFVKLSTWSLPFYFSAPAILLFTSLLFSLSVPNLFSLSVVNFSVLFLMSVVCLGVYSSVLGGWSSSCKFSTMGGVRSLVQSVSYEITLSFIVLSWVFLHGDSMWDSLESKNFNAEVLMGFFWYFSTLAEVGRSPLDLPEGESELVSGYNTEYGSSGFLIFFFSEYLMLLFFSYLTSVIFFKSSFKETGFTLLLIILSYIFARAVLPRMRYDHLMEMCWKMLLPCVLLIFFAMQVKSSFSCV